MCKEQSTRMEWGAQKRAREREHVDDIGLAADQHSIEQADSGQESGLPGQINATLHEMSQPLTALLCLLELGGSSESVDDLKRLMRGGLEECRRLQETVHSMQTQVRQTSEDHSSDRRVWTKQA